VTAILDTSYFVALLDKRDKNHAAADALSQGSAEAGILVSSVPTEAAYMIGRYMGYPAARLFVLSLVRTRLQFELVTPADLIRVAEIMQQYRDARLDFVDCTIIAVAERLNVTRVWTFDRRDFALVRPRHAPHFDLLP
jgi:predicted nucleic acid-binding protein